MSIYWWQTITFFFNQKGLVYVDSAGSLHKYCGQGRRQPDMSEQDKINNKSSALFKRKN